MTKRLLTYQKIGLTGGIGSGKSTAAHRFAALGAHVYHADEISRRSLDPGAACYERVISTFGQEIVNPDGTINRRRLGEIVFADEAKRRLLNGIIHPYVIDEIFSCAERDLRNDPNGIAIFEIPVLFESGMDARMDANIVVSCEEEIRIRRVMERDQLSREQVIARIRSQMSEEEKIRRADFILENNGTEDALNQQVDALFARLKAGGPRD